MHRIEETIDRDICIGCGACSAATGGAVKVTLGPTRMYKADITGASAEAVRTASRVCPFSDESPNEDELGAPHGDDGMHRNQWLGQYTRTFAGRVADDDYVMGSSSGGLTSWLLRKLLEQGHADATISVGRPITERMSLFEYSVMEPEDLVGQRKSQYYAASMAEVLGLIAESDRRYVLVGVPCFIRAARALCRERPEFRDRLPIFVALVCGHYKTQGFAESLAWQLGVTPDKLGEVDFRVKRPERGANDYDFAARDAHSGELVSAPVRELVGGNWGHSAFQPEACNFCDDVVGETADVSFGDAWLPQFISDPRGTNVVVSRNRVIDRLFDEGHAAGEIEVLEATPADVAASQAGGFRHRREGLAVRLADDSVAGMSVPKKRVAPDRSAVTPRRAALIRQRRRMAAGSHGAFSRAVAAGDLRLYLSEQRREISRYRRVEMTAPRRLFLWTKRAARSVLNALQRR
jgi:coenzyme F420 hydrogenase subunit beta